MPIAWLLCSLSVFAHEELDTPNTLLKPGPTYCAGKPFHSALGEVPEFVKDHITDVAHGACTQASLIPNQIWESASELRIFAYDLGKCEYFARFSEDRPDLMPAAGAVVPAPARKQIEAAIPKLKWFDGMSMCFSPHHALVWYDQKKEIVAYADVCFTCSGFIMNVGEESINIDADIDSIQIIFEQLGAPLTIEKACRTPSAWATVWQPEVNKLCKLQSFRKQGLAKLKAEGFFQEQDPPQYRNRCVQLPNIIQY